MTVCYNNYVRDMYADCIRLHYDLHTACLYVTAFIPRGGSSQKFIGGYKTKACKCLTTPP